MLLFAFVLSTTIFASASTWESWSAPYGQNGAAFSQEKLWIATDGGLRSIDLSGENSKVYTAADGLEETSQAGVASDGQKRVFAISKSGIFTHLQGQRFQVLSRSMVEKSDIPLSNGLLLRPGYAIVAFERRVVVFDIKKQVAVITFTQMGAYSPAQDKINGILLHRDTLFVASSKQVFKRFLNFDSLSNDRRLADPSTWQVVNEATTVGHIYYDKGIKIVANAGYSYAVGAGKFDRVVPGKNGGVWVRGDSLKLESLFDSENRALPLWMGISPVDSCRWILSAENIWKHCQQSTKLWEDPQVFPHGVVSAVDLRPGMEIVAWSYPYHLKIYPNGELEKYDFTYGSHYYEDSREMAVNQPLKTLALNDEGFVYTGTWGGSVFGHDPHNNFYRNFHEQAGECMEQWVDGYAIARGVSKTLGENTMFFSYWGRSGQSNYGIAWLSGEHELFCGNDIGSSMVSGPILSIKNGNDYDVFSVYENAIGADDGGVDFMKLTPTTSGKLQVLKKQKVYTGAVAYVRDLAWDSKFGRLWLLGASHIGYWEPVRDSVIIPQSLRGVSAAEYTALEVDIHGNIWVGTRNSGAFHIKLQHEQPDSLVATKITSAQGLLSNTVLDLAIDPVMGRVVFAHDVGLSIYHTFAVRSDVGYLEGDAQPIKVYPNPFRPGKHEEVTFDNLNSTGVFNLFNSAGKVVKTFSAAEMQGGGVQWDGIMANGQLAPPGIYHYVVRHNSKVHRGRLAIIR